MLTLEPEVQAVRIDVTVPAGADRLHLYRSGPSGTVADVRTYSAAVVTPGPIVARDFEAPLGVALHYWQGTWAAASPGTVTIVDLGEITIPDGGCEDWYLTDLVRVANTQKIVVETYDEWQHEAPTGVHRVLNRRTPITTTDVAWTPSFELAFVVDTDAARDQARACLGNGVPVLLRSPPQNGGGNMYFTVTGWTEGRVVHDARHPTRRFTVACVQVDRPNPLLFAPQPPAQYAQVAAEFATYADLAAGRASYDAVAYDYSGEQAADVVPWPPTDV